MSVRPPVTHSVQNHAWETVQDRLLRLLECVAEEKGPCKACATEVYFVRDRNSGKLLALTKDGVNHLLNCPGPPQKTEPEHGVLDSAPLPG